MHIYGVLLLAAEATLVFLGYLYFSTFTVESNANINWQACPCMHNYLTSLVLRT